MTLKNGFGKCSLFVLSAMDEKIRTWTLRFPAKENANMEIALMSYCNTIGQSNNAKYRLISRKFSGVKFFHQCVRVTNQKPRAFASLYPFDKPIRSLYFRSFVVSVLFARFHCKVIRKSLYWVRMNWNVNTNRLGYEKIGFGNSKVIRHLFEEVGFLIIQVCPCHLSFCKPHVICCGIFFRTF